MPFNSQGQYVPPGLPVYPPAPGTVISSNYFQQLMTDIFNALSLTFLRDGSVPFTGNLPLGGNLITGIGAGAAAAPALSFAADTGTGLYLNGTGKLDIAIGGAKAVEFTSKTINAPIAAPQTLVDAATITLDGTAGINFYLLATGAVGATRQIANWVNPNIGSSGLIFFQQDGTGSRGLTWGSNYKAPNGLANFIPTTTANAIDVFSYFVFSSTYTLIVPMRNPS